MKKYIKILIFVFLFFSVCFATNVYASDLEMKQLDIDATVNPDGSMKVVETWKIHVDETNTLFKNWYVDPTRYSGITDVEIKDLDTGRYFKESFVEKYHVDKGYFYALEIDNGEKFEIAWGIGMDNSSGTKNYQISYVVEDAVTLHEDFAELYWKFVGEEFEVPMDKINGTIKLPSEYSKGDIKVWGHTNTLRGTIYATNSNTVEFNLEDIPSREFVEVRVAFPTTDLTISKRPDKSIDINDIIAEETVWAQEANVRRERQATTQKFTLGGVGIVSLIVLAVQYYFPIKTLKRGTKKYEPLTKYDYFRELPREDATPA